MPTLETDVWLQVSHCHVIRPLHGRGCMRAAWRSSWAWYRGRGSLLRFVKRGWRLHQLRRAFQPLRLRSRQIKREK